MPEIKPFRGLLYNLKSVRPADVVAPPYDVIGPELRDALYRRSPHNIVRLDFSKDADPYASAGEAFAAWKAAGILAQAHVPAIYLLMQTFALPGGATVRRKGFIAACRLEEFARGSIFPHEKTLAKPKEDRLRLMESTHAVFSQIFGLYSDPKKSIEPVLEPWFRRDPAIDLEYDDVRNTLWACDDPVVTLAAADLLRHQNVVVADGHHRYETALLYRDAQRLKNPGHTGKEHYNFVPMFFTNVHDPGLVIFPTHRIVHGLEDFSEEKLLRDLAEHFSLEVRESPESLRRGLEQESHHAFGLVLAASPRYVLLRWRGKTAIHGKPGEPPMVAQLDVSMLHTLILGRMLGLTEEMQAQKIHLDYVRNASEAVAAVAGGTGQAAFLMNPPKMEQVRLVAEAGFTMPQKSTYFYPKLLSGLVSYALD
jgi:uncharacterized protein (DUF1015 family)